MKNGVLKVLACSVVLVIGGVLSLSAQEPQGPASTPAAGRILNPMGEVNTVLLMMAPTVQTELKLTEEQKKSVYDVVVSAQQKGRELTKSALQGRMGNQQNYWAAAAKLRQENEAALGKILKTEQKERVQQIILQIEGPVGLANSDLPAKLGLSKKQQQQIEATQQQLQQRLMQFQMQAKQAGLAQTNAEMFKKETDAVRNQANGQVGKILTGKQRVSYNGLLGDKFDIKKLDPDLVPPAELSSEDEPADEAKPKGKRKGTAKGK